MISVLEKVASKAAINPVFLLSMFLAIKYKNDIDITPIKEKHAVTPCGDFVIIKINLQYKNREESLEINCILLKGKVLF